MTDFAELFGSIMEVLLKDVITLGDVDRGACSTCVFQVRDLHVYHLSTHFAQIEYSLVYGGLSFRLDGTRVSIKIAAENSDFQAAYVSGKPESGSPALGPMRWSGPGGRRRRWPSA